LKKQTKTENLSNKVLPCKKILLLAVSTLLFSACSSKDTISPEEREAQLAEERSYTVNELEYKYEHIPKAIPIGKDISSSRSGFENDTDKAFSDIKSYKSQLSTKIVSSKIGFIKNKPKILRSGKNILPEEEALIEKREDKSIVSINNEQDVDEFQLKSVNATTNMTKFY